VGGDRVWDILDAKVVLSHLEVLTLNNLFLAIHATLLVIKYLLFVFIYWDSDEVFFILL